jgi:hypothetical protein
MIKQKQSAPCQLPDTAPHETRRSLRTPHSSVLDAGEAALADLQQVLPVLLHPPQLLLQPCSRQAARLHSYASAVSS